MWVLLIPELFEVRVFNRQKKKHPNKAFWGTYEAMLLKLAGSRFTYLSIHLHSFLSRKKAEKNREVL